MEAVRFISTDLAARLAGYSRYQARSTLSFACSQESLNGRTARWKCRSAYLILTFLKQKYRIIWIRNLKRFFTGKLSSPALPNYVTLYIGKRKERQD